MVEGSGIVEHMVCVGDIAQIPTTDVFIECRSTVKGVGHIRNRRGIPVADMTVDSGGIRFVAEPQINGRRKIGIGDGRRGRGLPEGETETCNR